MIATISLIVISVLVGYFIGRNYRQPVMSDWQWRRYMDSITPSHPRSQVNINDVIIKVNESVRSKKDRITLVEQIRNINAKTLLEKHDRHQAYLSQSVH